MKRVMPYLIVFCVTGAIAQDSHFSNFQNTPLYYNPAATGILKQDDMRFTNAHRRQWKKIVAPSRATNVSLDFALFRYSAMRLKSSFAGIGFNIMTDRYGTSKSGVIQSDISFMGAVRSERQIFSVGVSVGQGTRRIDPSGLTWDSQFNGYKFNPDLPTHETYTGGLKANYLNLSAGFMWTVEGDNGFFSQAGVSMGHINQPNVSFEGYGGEILNSKVTAHWKAEVPMRFTNVTRLGFNPHLLYSRQGPYNELIAGSSVKIYFREPSQLTLFRGEDAIEIGAAYRYGDALVLLLNYHRDTYNIGFSYDITTSSLRNAVNYRGGLELSFTWYGKIQNPYTRRGR